MAHMVSNLNLSPKEILAVTFTNKAAREMRERIITLLGKRRARGLTVSTFHSLGLRILKEDIDKLGYQKNYSIFDPSDQLSIIREALKKYHDHQKDSAFDKGVIISKIGFLKNKGITEDQYADSEYFDPESAYDHCTDYCYRFYQDKLKFFNAIDFDDILLLVVRLFKEFPDCAKKYSERFRFIMVDEYQDTNPLQFQMVQGLTTVHQNLCVVGDDDQAIYSFRGADISNILSFEKTYPHAKIIKLEENYRSTTPIIELANEVIKQNKQRRGKHLFSRRPSPLQPILWATQDTDHEAQIVADEIAKHQANGGHLGDIAILYRSNTQAPPLEDQLRLAEIPYTIVGGQKLYDKKEVKDLMAYLYVINNSSDELSLRRILNIPHRGIGTKTLEKFVERAKELNCTLFEAMEKHPELGARDGTIEKFIELIHRFKKQFSTYTLSESITNLIDEINYYDWVDRQYDSAKQTERKRHDIEYFIESANRFTRFNQGDSSLQAFVEKLLLQDSQDRNSVEDEDQDVRPNEVTMMTLHSSKGLEYKTIFLVGMEEELLPHKKTIQENGDIGEERRLCYVGITRAEERLFMTYCKQRKIYNKETPRFKSRFIDELKGYYLEQDRTTFGHLSPEEAEKYKKDFFADLLAGLDD